MNKYLAIAFNADGLILSAQSVTADTVQDAERVAQDLFYGIAQARHGQAPAPGEMTAVTIAAADVAALVAAGTSPAVLSVSVSPVAGP